MAYIVANEDDMFTDVILRETALLALCRYMSVSYELCEKYLPLLFTALDKEVCPKARTTVLIGLGDLAFRFPNALEPWTSHLYSRLNDRHTGVRYNTLTVLTHLILNDMIKVKGQVSHVVLCLNDDCDKIKDLAITFFTKLSERSNNPVYNLLGDIIATLSRDAVIVSTDAAKTDMTTTSKRSKKGVNEDEDDDEETAEDTVAAVEVTNTTNTMNTTIDTSFATALAGSDSMIHVAELSEAIINIPANKYLNKVEFQKVMSFMLSFVKKDIQANSLLDRLLVRLSMATSQAQKQKLSYCISQLKINEKGVKKIVEAFKVIKEALYDPEIREHLVMTVRSVKRTINVRGHHQSEDTQEGGGSADVMAATAAGGSSSTSASTAAETKNILLEFETLLDELDTDHATESNMNGMSLQDPNQTAVDGNNDNDENTLNDGESTNHSVSNTTSVLQSTKKGTAVKKAATKSKAKSVPVSASASATKKKKTMKSRYEESDDEDDNEEEDENVENQQINRNNKNKSSSVSAVKGKDSGRSATRRVAGGRSVRQQPFDDEEED